MMSVWRTVKNTCNLIGTLIVCIRIILQKELFMPKQEISTEKVKHTSLVVGLLNAIALPAFLVDSRLGAGLCLFITGAALYHFNKIGESRRPGSNMVNRMNNFFAPYTGDPSTDLDNTVRNIVNGGDSVYQQLFAEGRP